MLPPDASLPPERLRIGQCTVDVPSREIHAPEAKRPFRVTPKAMAVLLVLVDSADRVVSRETLLDQVWPDTLPSDDVLTQAVTQLRKAFHEVRGNPQYIETIAKGGYRLFAPVENLDDEAGRATVPLNTAPPTTDEPRPRSDATAVAAEPERVASPVQGVTGEQVHESQPAITAATPTKPYTSFKWPFWLAIVSTLLLLAIVVVGSWWLGSRRAAGAGEPAPAGASAPVAADRIEPFLITSAPGFELAPTLSPDGGLVAYMAIPEGQRNIAIMLQTTAPVAPRQLTFPEGMAEDSSPQWSPEARVIAFLRVTPGLECRLMVVSATGRAERTVGTCDPGNQPRFSWTPGGDGLILDRGERPGLQVLDLASGDFSAVDYDADPDHLDTSPRYSPDGRWIVFLRNSPLGDFWRIPVGGGTAERLTDIAGEILGWDWMPDSSAFIYARRTDGVSRLYRFDIAAGSHAELGVEDGEQPAVARNAPALAYVVRHPRFGIYRFPASGELDGERLFASSGRDRSPSIAPDGRQLVFVSDRAGPFGLWWGDVDEPGSLRMLEGIQPDSRQPAAWSSDSQRVLVIGSQERNSSGSADLAVLEVFTDSGRVSRVPLPVTQPVQAMFAPGPNGPDQRLLVLSDRGDGRRRLSLFAETARPGEALATMDDVTRVQVDAPRNRIIFSRVGDPGLWQADLDLDQDSIQPVVLRDGTARWQHAWATAENGGTYLVRRTPDCPALLIHDRGTRESGAGDAAVGEGPMCLDRTRRAATRAFTFNPRTRELFIALAEYDGGDIGFATLDEAE